MFNSLLPQQIKRYEDGTVLVSAVLAADTGKYEVGIAHPSYNEGHIITVFASDDREETVTEWQKWVDIFTEGPLPEYIDEPPTSALSTLIFALTEDTGFRRHHKEQNPLGRG